MVWFLSSKPGDVRLFNFLDIKPGYFSDLKKKKKICIEIGSAKWPAGSKGTSKKLIWNNEVGAMKATGKVEKFQLKLGPLGIKGCVCVCVCVCARASVSPCLH